MERSELLRAMKRRLSEVQGERLRGVILSDSEARSDAEEDSRVEP